MSLLVDQYGEPLSTPAEAPTTTTLEVGDTCPRCGEAGDVHTVTAFGGHWRLLCACGFEFARGRGVAPLGGA
jgi:hypothetical protein